MVLIIFFEKSAWAYIDPGNGSLTFQLLAAGLAAIFVALRIILKKLKSRTSKKDGGNGNQV